MYMERIKLLMQIITLQKQILELQKKLQERRRESIYEEALRHLGEDASPLDRVDDVVGCAESVTEILNKVMGFPIITGTWTMWDYLKRDSRFKKTSIPMPGDIVISPTEGKRRGHVGIVGKHGAILSSVSLGKDSGKFMANYTLDTWFARYRGKMELPVHFYTRV